MTMFFFWPEVIEPLLRASRPKAVIEIGAEYGDMTTHLLEFGRAQEAVVHVVDPVPAFDSALYRERYGDTLVLHEDLSHRVIPGLERLDFVLLDGDHNWYTVYHELRLMESHPSVREHGYPLVLLHDVDWPYGRRDLYYDLETVPPDERQPHAHAGMVQGRTELVEEGGLNAKQANARHEGGPRNGVRTALEDFLAETDHDLHLATVPGNHGLAIVVPARHAAAGAPVALLLERLASAEFLEGHCRSVEGLRLETLAQVQQLNMRRASMRRTQEHIRRLSKEVAKLEGDLRKAEGRSPRRISGARATLSERARSGESSKAISRALERTTRVREMLAELPLCEERTFGASE